MSDTGYVVGQKEAADFLKVSTKSISRYRKRGLPYKLILNPVTGKQEVRFSYADLERWDEGRQLLATYPRDGEEPAAAATRPVKAGAASVTAASGEGFLDDLLIAYKDQIEMLRQQLEDMREQLARRDRQINDLMRLMVGLRLEYKPELPTDGRFDAMDTPRPTADIPQVTHTALANAMAAAESADSLYTVVHLSDFDVQTTEPVPPAPVATRPAPTAGPAASPAQPGKQFSREQLATTILRFRQKGKSYEEIAQGLNQIQVATLSGHAVWTAIEVQSLLPGLVNEGGLYPSLERNGA